MNRPDSSDLKSVVLLFQVYGAVGLAENVVRNSFEIGYKQLFMKPIYEPMSGRDITWELSIDRHSIRGFVGVSSVWLSTFLCMTIASGTTAKFSSCKCVR